MVLPIAVEMVVTIVIAAAAPAIWNPEHAVDGAYCPTDARADRAANHPADRTGCPATFVRAFLRAAHDALCVSDSRNGEKRHRKR